MNRGKGMIDPLNTEAAFGALVILDYLQGLFTAAGQEVFSRDSVLVILNRVKNDPELFDEGTLLAYEKIVESLEAE